MLVGTKADAISDPVRRHELEHLATEMGVPWAVISAVSGEGIEGMLNIVFTLAGNG
jgi:hypothetical protein